MGGEGKQAAIRRSALWSAWADAMGFATELADERLVERRTGDPKMRTLVPWRRRVGGRGGPTVRLPAGMYSDDTQLRLATARAIRGDGAFDVDAFAKVELPVWRAYALGAGRGSSAAARSLAQPTTRWSSNFFSTAGSQYLAAGGNGAAMRVQPHVWASPRPDDWRSFMPDVIRNTICTHGHPRGIVGAVLHAGVLAHALSGAGVPGPDQWRHTLEQISTLPSLINADEALATLWLPAWERAASRQLSTAVAESVDECELYFSEVNRLLKELGTEPASCYREIATHLDARNPEIRGSGTLTVVLAVALAWLARTSPAETLTAAVNELGTDTDTIATMAGAIVGVSMDDNPPTGVVDEDLIVREADRLSAISQGTATSSFSYPDLLGWRPPKTQVEAVGYGDHDALALSGLGYLRPRGDILASDRRSAAVWQWHELAFGQHVLLRRRERPAVLPKESRPVAERAGRESRVSPGPQGSQLAFMDRRKNQTGDVTESGGRTVRPTSSEVPANETTRPARKIPPHHRTEDYADAIIKSGFDPGLIGRAFVEVSQTDAGFEEAVALAAVIAKAIRARRDRDRRQSAP